MVITVNQFFTAGRVVVGSDLLTVLPRHFIPVTALPTNWCNAPAAECACRARGCPCGADAGRKKRPWSGCCMPWPDQPAACFVTDNTRRPTARLRTCPKALTAYTAPMKIQLLSDLHLEAHPHFVPEPAPGADVLVLAGDIGSYQEGGQLGDEDFGLARFSPLPQWGAWPTPVLFRAGQPRIRRPGFDEAHQRLRRTCDKLGIAWLERETLVLDQVRFVGTTLWSDFDALADHEQTDSLTRRLQLRDKAFRGPTFTCAKPAAPAAASISGRTHARASPGLPGMVASGAEHAVRRNHRGRHALRPQPAQRRPALRPGARHRRFLQRTGPPAAPRATVAASATLHAPSDYTVSGTDPATQEAWQCRWWRTRWGMPARGTGHLQSQLCLTV